MPRLCNQWGITTLVEQLCALSLGLAVIASLYSFHRSELFHLLAQETKITTLEDARGAMDMMSRDLRLAGSWGTGAAPSETGAGDDPDADADSVCNRVYAATERVVHIQMDLNGNGNCADTNPRENIRYELTGPTGTCPGKTIIRRNGDCLVAHVTVPNSALFTYYDEHGAELGNTPPLGAIKRIRISFSIGIKQPATKTDTSVYSALSTSVELRNR